MTKIPYYEQCKIAYFDALYAAIRLHAQGKGRAKTKNKLWTNVMDMWDQESDIPAPTLSWLNNHHPEFHQWCLKQNKLILDCNEGLFVPTNKEEIDHWVTFVQKPRQEGCARSNNGQQDLIAEKNPEASRGLFRTVLQALLPPPNH